MGKSKKVEEPKVINQVEKPKIANQTFSDFMTEKMNKRGWHVTGITGLTWIKTDQLGTYNLVINRELKSWGVSYVRHNLEPHNDPIYISGETTKLLIMLLTHQGIISEDAI